MSTDDEQSETLGRIRHLESIVNRSHAIAFRWRVAEGWPVEFVSENVRQLGYTPEDLLSGRVSWPGITHPEDVPRLEREVASHLRDGVDEFSQTYRLRTASGEWRWMEDRNLVIRDSDGRITHIQGIVLDVTERKRAEGALRQARDELERRVAERTAELAASEERYRTLINGIPDGVYRLDREGNFLYVTDHVIRRSGRSREWFLSHSFLDLLEPEAGEHARAYFEAVLRGERPGLYVFAYPSASGEMLYVEVNPVPVREGGEVVGIAGVSRDITARRRAEEALRRSEERWRSLVEHAPVIIATADRDGTITFLNRAAPGQPVDDVIGRTVYDYIPPRHHRRARAALGRVFKDGTSQGHDVAARGPGGAERWYSVRLGPIWGDGHVEAAVIIATDITQRRRARQALLESEARYRAVVSDQTEMITRYLPGSAILTFVNKACWQRFASSPGEMIGRPMTDFVPEEHRAAILEGLSKLTPENPAFTVEHPVVERGGEVRWEQWTNRAIFDDEGRIVEYQGVGRDVSERRRAEEALRRRVALEHGVSAISAKFLALPPEAAAEGLDYALATLGALTGVDRTYLFQYSDDATRVSNTHEWCAEGIEPQIHNLQDQAVADAPWLCGRLMRGEAVHLPRVADMPDEAAAERVMLQQQGIQSLLLVPMISGGRPVGFVGFDSVRAEMTWADEDIALLRTVGNIITHSLERRRAEEEMRRIERLESLGVLAGGIAHDFSNLLTGILGSLARARAESPEASEGLAEAERAALRAQGITRQLLSLSKSGAPVKTVASIADLIIQTAQFALSGSNCRCRLDVPADLWPVEADLDQISQIVQNLVINADQAMPDGGVVEVRARNVPPDEPGPRHGARRIEIVVADSGVGIPREHHDRLFDPYFTTKEAGSGLGLAVCHSVVQRHGGHISVDSECGVGATFRVTLPASDREPPAPADAASATVRRTARVLFMDDEAVLRRMARWLLAHIGYQVVCAEDGQEAIALYREAMEAGEPFEAVVLDLTVPGAMGGLECLQKLRELDPDVAAIVCSGYSTEPVLAEHRRHGFRGVVLKPYELEDLDAALQRLLAGRDARRQGLG